MAQSNSNRVPNQAKMEENLFRFATKKISNGVHTFIVPMDVILAQTVSGSAHYSDDIESIAATVGKRLRSLTKIKSAVTAVYSSGVKVEVTLKS